MQQHSIILIFTLKTLVSVSLALAVALAPLGKRWVLFAFQMNQAYIAQNLCEKREVEENECQGKCHLNKALAEEEQQEKNTTETFKYQVEVLFCEPFQATCYVPTIFLEKRTFGAPCSPAILQGFKDKIQHPPTV